MIKRKICAFFLHGEQMASAFSSRKSESKRNLGEAPNESFFVTATSCKDSLLRLYVYHVFQTFAA